MGKMINIVSLKVDRPKAIMEVKNNLRLPIIDAKALIDRILADREVEWDAWDITELYTYREIFNGEVVEDRPSNENIIEPDEETKEVLVWYDGLSEDDKRRVEVYMNWHRPQYIAAVC